MLLAASLPPFGWWPLAIVGAGLLVSGLREQPPRWRFVCGLAAGAGLYGPSLWWVVDFSVPGYVVLLLVESAIIAAALLLVPDGPMVGRMLAFPGALVLAEMVRGHFPLGGLPLAGIDLGQAASPLAPAARLGGHLLLVALVGLGGVVVALLGEFLVRRVDVRVIRETEHADGRSALLRIEPRRQVATAVAAAALVLLVVGIAALGASAGKGAPGRLLRVAAVQGGGPRGLRAIDVDASTVFDAHLETTARLKRPVDLVVWPENVVNVDGPLDGSREDAAMSDLARRLNATIVAGVVEDEPGNRRFRNAAVAWASDGSRVARYDKVHRVPFGEYIPARSLVSRLADVSAVPRDAIAGRGPGVLTTPVGPLGVVISYEVFFSDRARAAIQGGGQMLLVPTNASSYRSSQVPAQELAAARLRALETGRAVVQAAPTGFSALVDANGHVAEHSDLGPPAIIEGRVRMRSGETLATRLGETPLAFAAIVTLVAAWTSRILNDLRPGRATNSDARPAS
ncbi:MAG TPA: apolipoprotein N-acyltransferase [Acidimicrobiales bacterium]|nr:apolipoprotein N-acyltransferase [Acidimicrobiales bacterium]